MGMSLYIIQSLAYYEESSNKYVYSLVINDNIISSLIAISYENETFSVIANNTELLVTTIDSASTDTQYPSAKAVYTPLTDNEKTIAQTITELLERVKNLETKIQKTGSLEVDTITINRGINQNDNKGNSLIEAAGTPTITPEFKGQRYLNTVTGVFYNAKDTNSAADWV